MKLLSLLLVCIFACTAFSSGLVAEYKFDGSLIDTGSDGNSTDTLSQNNSVYQQGMSVDALYCDSISCTAADSADLDLPAKYTIEAFIKPYSLSGVQTVLSKTSYQFVINDGNLGFYHTQSNGTIVGSCSVPLTLNKWQHIAVAADGSAITLYLNGKAAANFVYNGTILNSTSVLSIGGTYHGLIDEVRMFGQIKTAAFIYSRAKFNCGSLPQEDIDGDCHITIDDFYVLTDQWLLSGGY
jgi:hypothetical protein